MKKLNECGVGDKIVRIDYYNPDPVEPPVYEIIEITKNGALRCNYYSFWASDGYFSTDNTCIYYPLENHETLNKLYLAGVRMGIKHVQSELKRIINIDQD